jgi:outer membrane receptor for ferrienterochelin and colicins
MIRWFFILVVLIRAGFTSAQVLSIEVNIPDETPYGVHVALILNHKNQVKYGISNVQGKVSFPWPGDTTILVISRMGYMEIRDTLYTYGQYTYTLVPSAIRLNDFVYTGEPVPTSLGQSVHKIRVIDKERIQAQGAQNLRDLLQQDLNIRVTQDGMIGSGVSMQGVGGDNIKIMVDGVPLIGRLDGNIDLSQVQLQGIEKVEIVEGPMSVQYGSNALGGVINLITQKDMTHSLDGNMRLFYESVGHYNVDVSTGFKWGKNRIRVGAGRYFFSGSSPGDTIPSRFKVWKPREQILGNVMVSRKMKDMDFRFQADVYHEYLLVRGRPETPFFVKANDQHFRTWRSSQSLFLNGFLAEGHHLDLMVSYSLYSRNRENYRKDLTTLSQSLIDRNEDLFQLGMSRGFYTWTPGTRRHWQVQGGYEFNLETAEGQRIVDGFQLMSDLAGFGTISFLPSKSFTAKAGLRYGWNNRFAAIPVPSIHLRWSPYDGLLVRGSYARGFRAPSLKELFFEFVDINHRVFGNPLLLAESSHNIQYEIAYKTSGVDRSKVQWEFSGGGFYNYIMDPIRMVLNSANLDIPEYRNENIPYFRTLGGRVNAGFHFKNLGMGMGYTYTGSENGLFSSSDGNRMLYFSEFQSSFRYHFPRWRGSIQGFYKFSGAQPILYRSAENLPGESALKESIIEGFHNLDLSYTQSFFKNRIQVVLLGKNLFNVTQIAQTGNVGGVHGSGGGSLPALWGRTFAISLNYQFVSNR